MSRDVHESPTRREYVKYGGAVVGGGLFAGCTGSGESESSDGGDSKSSSTRHTSETATEGPSRGETNASEGASYSVTMAPMGEVEFDAVPESIFTRLTHLAGMTFALGRGDDVNALHAPDYYDALWNQFTPRLDGVSLDWKGLYSSWKPSKEKLYELDSDVHLADPAGVFALDKWSTRDVEEIRENVGPWFGNYYSDKRADPPGAWANRYEYYGLWEMFEKVADVFRELERYAALADVRAGLLKTIRERRPAEDERPTAVMVTAADVEKDIWAYTLSNPGFLTAHTRPLGPRDAFDGTVDSGSVVDFETLLEADPDVMLFLGGMMPDVSMAELRSTLESHPVAAEIAAVRNGRVHPQGARYQGPILNLFQLEMTAKQLYPDAFGEWPTYTEGPYPEIPEDERLFGRQRVADIINGDVSS